ncbi:Uncharacterised protein [Salmonella enterica subsp. enterica serovar Typhi]|nr:Uncharacterised protein [Salmonella enterica subsp. enterica serovar Typhi]
MTQGMTPDLQRPGIISGINAPQHHVHQHVILLSASGSQDALRPGGIFRQQLHLYFRFFDRGLNALETAAVFRQLQQHQVIARCVANAAALAGGLFSLNAQAMLPCGTQAHRLRSGFCCSGAEIANLDVFHQCGAAVVLNHIGFVNGFKVFNPVTFRVVDN